MPIPLDQEIRVLRSIFWSDRDPEGRAFVPLADAYRRSGEFRKAVELLNEGLERHPDFASAHAVAARLFLEKGLVEEAEIAARRVLDLDEDNVHGLELLAGALEQRGISEEAASLRSHLAELSGHVVAPVAEEEADAEEVMELAALAPDAGAEGAEEEEDVLDLAALAPDEVLEEDEEVLDLADLAPGESEEEEPVDLALLAPDEAVEEAEEEIVDLAALAPDEALGEDEEVLNLAALAPDEALEEGEAVIDLADLAPEEIEEEEPMDLALLAPDEGVEEAEEIVELAALAPDEALGEEIEEEEEVVDLADLAPEEVAEEAEEIVELAALAPDEALAEGEEVLDLAALAPDEALGEEIEEEEHVVDLADLAPEGEIFDLSMLEPYVEADEEEEILDLAELAPAPEEEAVAVTSPGGEADDEVFDLSTLAPFEPPPEEQVEDVFDLALLAPDESPEAEPAEAEPEVEPVAYLPEEPVVDLDDLAPTPGWLSTEDQEIVTFASDAGVSSAEVLPDDPLPSDEVPDEPQVVTRTMGELYARQGLTDRALEVFRQLLETAPGDQGLRRRIAELEAAVTIERAAPAPEPTPATGPATEEDEGVAGHAWDAEAQRELHEVDTPFAWTEEVEEVPAAGPAIGLYFERLLAWEPVGGWEDEGEDADDAAGSDA